MDPSIVDTAMTSRKRKREEYKKIILLAAACVVHMVIGVVTCRSVVYKLHVNVTSNNVKNRIKLWTSWYGIVSDILGQSGFDWDGTKHMITVENENAWNEYCTVLQNWDDIVDLCAKDRVIGHGAETVVDAEKAKSRETNEVELMGLGATAIDLEEPSSNTKGKRQGSTSSGTHPHKRKMGEKEGIAASLDKMANSFNRMVEKRDGKVDDEDIQEFWMYRQLNSVFRSLGIVDLFGSRSFGPGFVDDIVMSSLSREATRPNPQLSNRVASSPKWCGKRGNQQGGWRASTKGGTPAKRHWCMPQQCKATTGMAAAVQKRCGDPNEKMKN
ncbi:hypothetical protein JHK86_001500 [Glycine max]|nr:hypothetical protein JHK86_001500 [Glycine max]